MAKLELGRLSLFFAEWILSAVALALFPSKLYRTTVPENESVCAIGSPSFCQFGISWTLIGLLILTLVISWHMSEYCSKYALPPLLEMLLIAFLTIWWLVAAIAFSAVDTNDEIIDVTASARRGVRASAWLLVLLFLCSTVVAWIIARNDANREVHDETPSQSAPLETGYTEFR